MISHRRRVDSRGRPGNYPMGPAEIASGVYVVSGMDFSSTKLGGCGLDDIDLELAGQTFKELENISNDQGEKHFFGQFPQNILKSLMLVDQEGIPNIAGLLLFGKKESLRYRIPSASVRYQQFGLKGEVLENEEYEGPLVKLIPRLINKEGPKKKTDEFLYRGQSITIPEYSEKAIREAIANALSHRDYTYQNSVQIQLFTNELIITSPGGFPRGVRVDKLLSVSPSPRNRILSNAMRRLRLSEGSGRGIDFIYHGQAKYGRPMPDYSESNNDQVSVRISGGKANLEFCKLTLSIDKSDLSINEMLLLNTMFLNKVITLDEASETLQLSNTRVKEILISMDQKGLIESTETDNFSLKASLSPLAKNVVTPKRLSTEDKQQHKKIIKDILHRRGEQSREAMADATGLSYHQCYRLLKELEQEGIVCLVQDSRKWGLNE